MAFKMKYKNLQGVVDELKGAVKAHGKQAKIIEKHIDNMEGSPMKKTVSWMYGGKKYSGDFIRETKDKIFARTHNNKVKTIVKGKTKRS
jgi:hypothetical protein